MTWKFTLTAAVWLFVAITLYPSGGNCQPSRNHGRRTAIYHPMVNPIVVKALICAYAIKNHAKPAYVAAVAHVESRIGRLEFRTWKTGDYYQPMGLQYEQRRKFAKRGLFIDTLDGNIEVGAMSFAGIHDLAALKRRLKDYNSSFDSGYWSEIKKAVAKYEKEFRG